MKSIRYESMLLGLCALFTGVIVIGMAVGVFESYTLGLLVALFTTTTLPIGGFLLLSRIRAKRALWPALLFFGSSLGLVFSAAVNNWPVRASYALSHNALDFIARRVRAGEEIAVPVRAGLFVIRAAGLSSQGAVCLWTVLDPAGNTGFVQCPGSDVAAATFNLASIRRMDSQWQFIAED